MILSRIIEEKRREIEEAKRIKPQEDLIRETKNICIKSTFKKNISRPHHINLIAEIKKASPSKGILRGDFSPVKIAITYQANGASAISILTDERFFEGRLEYIKKVKENVSLPVLRKDFFIDEYQIYETVAAGGDAVILICEILSTNEIIKFNELAHSLGLDCLVEIHNEEDLEKALAAGANIIGINNRDLHTFRVDIGVTQKLARLIPKDKTIVSESGIKSYEDVMFLKSLGVNAVLIGEAFMEADDIAAKMRDIMRY
ncbi:MAG: indole-3-glycerol phosphate synthase TrpC [Candidatus Omnitrophica bacterium]|nr:indole-3-glycerol phosphate synthase TrpC [Candidatus Omnitrophota bacterium]MBI5143904.1 indole-3-glycerol phosphate synthase TrpC [Candidatus Omnitrophota bacterium]